MRTFYLMLCLVLLPLSLVAKPKDFRVLPQPQKMELTSGKKGLWGRDIQFITLKSDVPFPVLGNLLDGLPRTNHKRGVGVTLQINPSLAFTSNEGYTLSLDAKGVLIEAKTDTGLFYGCQTLEQLMEDSRDLNEAIPAMHIVDYPAIAYRSIQLDTKNHLDRTEYYYQLIDRLAKYKINGIIWELEDKLRYTRRPEVASPDAISKEEMQAISAYAKERHIEISPLVQGLGHAGFILKHHWELRENVNSDWEFCPSDPRTYEVQFDLYLDALEALPDGKYLHIGGDEVGAIGIDERCKATGKSGFELQMLWLKRVCDFAVAHGRTPIFWDDMPIKYAGMWPMVLEDHPQSVVDERWNGKKLDEAVDLFPKECIYMRWNYGDPTHLPHRKLLDWYAHKDLKVMAATAAADGDSPVMPRYNSKIAAIRNFSQLVVENNLEGILATSWDDGSPHLETVWRGFIAQAEFGWNPTARTEEAYATAHAQREFGFLPQKPYLSFITELEDALTFYDGALVDEGRRNPAWGTTHFKLMTLPNPAKPGEWSTKYKEKIDEARREEKRYAKLKVAIADAQQNALRNRYTLDIYEQINELQHYPTQLLLALHAYDKASAGKKDEALKELLAVCDAFQAMRNDVEATYGKTRFMSRPAGYIQDKNHHNHLASKTLNSDWMFYYEKPMVNQIQWWAKSLK